MTKHALLKLYQDIPYPSLAFAQTHPNQLATIAILLGLEPPHVDNCRLLELGCAIGGNIIPMACTIPDSQIIGIDFASNQIEIGRTTIEALGLENITLKTMDILDITSDFGEFDYIIAHGIYSWTPSQVRDKVMAICKANLAQNGVAYISYNTYPGWHMLNISRDLMLYHSRNDTEPLVRAKKARAALDFLIQSLPTDHKGYADFLKPYLNFLQHQLERVGDKKDTLLLHDEIAEFNNPVHFHQFVEHAAQHGLQYLAEANFSTIMPNKFPPHVQENLRHMATDLIEMEQYMDYLLNRMFRQTLLCHAKSQITRVLNPARLVNLHFASRAKPVSDKPNIEIVSVERFQSVEGATLSTDHPVSKAAMSYLHQICPQTAHFRELFNIARSMVPRSVWMEDPNLEAMVLGQTLLQGYTYGGNLVNLFMAPPKPTTKISQRPLASRLARFQVTHSNEVTNLYHERVSLDEITRSVLSHLDGTQTKVQLLDKLIEWTTKGGLKISSHGEHISDCDTQQKILSMELDIQLQWLAKAALLVG